MNLCLLFRFSLGWNFYLLQMFLLFQKNLIQYTLIWGQFRSYWVLVKFQCNYIFFKVINRSLPTVSYLTSLDWYAIVCIFFVCLMCSWNGIIASTWDDDKPFADWADFWAFVAFACLFIVINVGVTIWFYFAYDKIRKMKAKEARFLLMLKENLHRLNDSPAIISAANHNKNQYENPQFEMSL